MENNSKFFANTACKYFPCHEGIDRDEFNCIFCYCPLNGFEHCPGDPVYIETKDKKIIKDCMGCNFPHKPENYEIIINFLKKKMHTFDRNVLEEQERKKAAAEE